MDTQSNCELFQRPMIPHLTLDKLGRSPVTCATKILPKRLQSEQDLHVFVDSSALQIFKVNKK